MPKKAPFEYDYSAKVLLLGDVGVGKTSLLLSWTEPEWKAKGHSTLPPGEEAKSKLVSERGKRVMLNIFDTAGQESHKALTSTFYRGTQTIILVYDVTNQESFYSLKNWIAEATHYCPDATYILVGNKCDLTEQRKVPTEWGNDLAKEKVMPFVETCANDAQSVANMFGITVTSILDACTKPATPLSSGAPGSGDGLIRLDDNVHKGRRCC
ncbi:glycine--tRNA ligase 2 [Pelomyxa schiedti]|nr:glycine--tRNA ligase 2 [Pelomyxa schiedti]